MKPKERMKNMRNEHTEENSDQADWGEKIKVTEKSLLKLRNSTDWLHRDQTKLKRELVNWETDLKKLPRKGLTPIKRHHGNGKWEEEYRGDVIKRWLKNSQSWLKIWNFQTIINSYGGTLFGTTEQRQKDPKHVQVGKTEN